MQMGRTYIFKRKKHTNIYSIETISWNITVSTVFKQYHTRNGRTESTTAKSSRNTRGRQNTVEVNSNVPSSDALGAPPKKDISKERANTSKELQ